MTKIRTHRQNPDDPASQAERVSDALRALDATTEYGGVYFGHPNNPADDADTTLPGSTTISHNGLIENVKGSWVGVELSAGDLNTPITCYHNLGIPIIAADEPNVRWLSFMWQHSGEQETWWEDIRVNPNSMRVGTGGPDWAIPWIDDGKGSPGVGLYWFDDNEADEYMYFNVEMPRNWRQGTAIYPRVHWVPAPGGAPQAGEICWWELEYTWANIGDLFPATTLLTGLTHYPDDDPVVANNHYVTYFDDPTDGIDGAGQTVSSVLACRLGRLEYPGNGFTNLGEDAGLLMVTFRHQVDGFGSEFNVNRYLKTDTTALESGTISCRYQENDTVAADSIDLRFHANPILAVNVSNKLKGTLFFTPAVR